MAADLSQLPSPILPATFPVATVTVAVRLFYRQRALGYLLGSFVGIGGLLFVGLLRVRGPQNLLAGLAAGLFWLVPFAISYLCRRAYIKPAQLSFTTQGVCLAARDTQYQVAWENLAAYQVEFSLQKLVGAGYWLKLREVQGHAVAFNLLERQLLAPESGLRPDSALAYLSRYIGWHNRQVAAAGEGEPIVYRPSLLCRKTGTVLLTALGVLLVADLWLRWQHPAAKGTSWSVLAGALVTGLQVLGQKQQGDRYARYLLALQATGISPAEGGP